MGIHYQFTCGSCGYEAEVSGGGDVGMICETITVICEECQKLYDVVVLERQARGKKKVVPRCPLSPRHHVKPWNAPGSCPQCGDPMDRGEVKVMWD